MEQAERESVIVRTSFVGIITNAFLAATKFVVGLITGSVAVMADAINNFTDALSSIVTIVGTKLSMKQPDKNHPIGYGRIEYMTAMIVAVIILYAGISAIKESITTILEPVKSEFTVVTLGIIAFAVVVKIVLGRYTMMMGKKADSSALEASGKDALFDAILSTSVLISSLILFYTDVSIEAYVGILIAIFIIRTGLEILFDSLGDLLGKRSDPEIAKKVKEIITAEPGVYGAYDLFINNYGPQRDYASVHIEVDSDYTAEDIDVLSRGLQIKVYKETGIVLTALGIYCRDVTDPAVVEMRQKIMEYVSDHDWVIEVHGFHADTVAKKIRFDMVLSFDVKPAEALAHITKDLSELYPDYTLEIVPDVDISD